VDVSWAENDCLLTPRKEIVVHPELHGACTLVRIITSYLLTLFLIIDEWNTPIPLNHAVQLLKF